MMPCAHENQSKNKYYSDIASASLPSKRHSKAFFKSSFCTHAYTHTPTHIYTYTHKAETHQSWINALKTMQIAQVYSIAHQSVPFTHSPTNNHQLKMMKIKKKLTYTYHHTNIFMQINLSKICIEILRVPSPLFDFKPFCFLSCIFFSLFRMLIFHFTTKFSVEFTKTFSVVILNICRFYFGSYIFSYFL